MYEHSRVITKSDVIISNMHSSKNNFVMSVMLSFALEKAFSRRSQVTCLCRAILGKGKKKLFDFEAFSQKFSSEKMFFMQ